jgi:hypothetical protein
MKIMHQKINRKEASLIKEYELCWEHVKQLDTNIWTTSGVIGLGSLVTFFTVGMTSQNEIIGICIGLLAISIIWIWWKISGRWWDIQHAIILRMIDIEEDIGYFQNRIVSYLDNSMDIRKKEKLFGLNESRIAKFNKSFPKFYKGSVRGTIGLLPIIISILWFIYFMAKIPNAFWRNPMQTLGTISVTWVGILIVLASAFLGGIGIGLIIGFSIGLKKR